MAETKRIDAGAPSEVAGQVAGGAAAPPASLARELEKMDWEPLLPVEKKLIGWSITLGVVLLGLLVWVSRAFFAVQP